MSKRRRIERLERRYPCPLAPGDVGVGRRMIALPPAAIQQYSAILMRVAAASLVDPVLTPGDAGELRAGRHVVAGRGEWQSLTGVLPIAGRQHT
jgi:hypothetical protein